MYQLQAPDAPFPTNPIARWHEARHQFGLQIGGSTWVKWGEALRLATEELLPQVRAAGQDVVLCQRLLRQLATFGYLGSRRKETYKLVKKIEPIIDELLSLASAGTSQSNPVPAADGPRDGSSAAGGDEGTRFIVNASFVQQHVQNVLLCRTESSKVGDRRRNGAQEPQHLNDLRERREAEVAPASARPQGAIDTDRPGCQPGADRPQSSPKQAHAAQGPNRRNKAPGSKQPTKLSQALSVFVQNPALNNKQIAEIVGCDPSLLSKRNAFRRARDAQRDEKERFVHRSEC